MSRLCLVGPLVARPDDLIATDFAGRASVLVVSTSLASASATMAGLRSRGWTAVQWDPAATKPRRSAYDVVWVDDGDAERLLALTAEEPAFAPIVAAVRRGDTRYLGVGVGASIAAAQLQEDSARLGRLDRRTGLGLIAQWMSPDDEFTDWGEVRVTLGAHDAIMVEDGVPRIIAPVPASPVATERERAGAGSIRSPFDGAALRTHPTRAAVQAFWTRFPSEDVPGSFWSRAVLALVISCFFITAYLFLVVGGVQGIARGGDDRSDGWGMLFFAAPMLPAAVYLAGLWRVATPRRHRRGWYLRIDAFARANGLSYLAGEPRLRRVPIPLPYATASDVVLARDGDDTVQFANVNATSAAGGRSRRGGAVITRLDHPLPNIWLQSRGHARIAVFGRLQRSQRLSLEGGFDRHFAMFVPRGYERDALYLFTPDVLALLIDHVADFDVELSGTRLVLSGPRDVVTLDARRWEDARIAIASLRSKTAQWARWRDEHPTDHGGSPQLGDEVRPSGRRLRRSAVVPYTLAVVATAAWFFLGLMLQTN